MNAVSSNDDYLDLILKLNVNRSGDRRAPHKPLLLLVSIAKFLQGKTELDFKEVEAALNPLLSAYAPPVKGRHQPEVPYWHLRNDKSNSLKLWVIPGAEDFPLQKGEFPKIAALRSSSGHLDEGFARALTEDKAFLKATIDLLLSGHFPESLHDSIMAAIGLEPPEESFSSNTTSTGKLTRDPNFRIDVLRAYEHRCAVSGFRVALGGNYFGCEAAHVKWHAYDGPDTINNGFALSPTLHKLFDAGAWTLSDDRRVLVSAELTGTAATVGELRAFHGQSIRAPLSANDEIALEFIRWHRKPELGGVFRHPALPEA